MAHSNLQAVQHALEQQLVRAAWTENFSQPSETSDVVLIVEGKKLYVDRHTLSMSSPVFRTMLTTSFKEANTNKVPLPGKNYKSMVEFLTLIYPPMCPGVHTDVEISALNVAALVLLAEEYQVKRLKQRCESFLRSLCNRDKMVSMLAFDSALSLVGSCAHVLEQNYEDLLETETIAVIESKQSFGKSSWKFPGEFLYLIKKNREHSMDRLLTVLRKFLENQARSAYPNEVVTQLCRCSTGCRPHVLKVGYGTTVCSCSHCGAQHQPNLITPAVPKHIFNFTSWAVGDVYSALLVGERFDEESVRKVAVNVAAKIFSDKDKEALSVRDDIGRETINDILCGRSFRGVLTADDKNYYQ